MNVQHVGRKVQAGPCTEFGLGRAWIAFELIAGIDDDSNHEPGRPTIHSRRWDGSLLGAAPEHCGLP
ncbi:hypothetical protein [Streptomyces sp. NPDC052042]|uniref:hypothetical protein n=1 Tax=Streptomyces sp. NPDC052042 TaxID=3365683 RepID=UPI0037D0049A